MIFALVVTGLIALGMAMLKWALARDQQKLERQVAQQATLDAALTMMDEQRRAFRAQLQPPLRKVTGPLNDPLSLDAFGFWDNERFIRDTEDALHPATILPIAMPTGAPEPLVDDNDEVIGQRQGMILLEPRHPTVRAAVVRGNDWF